VPRKPARHGRLRDALIVAAVLVLAGVAVADALRGDGDGSEPVPDTASEPARTETDPFRERPGVPATGSLVVLDTAGCALRQIVVSSGQELPLPPLETGCELWAAPRGGLVAYALEGPYGDFKPFRIVDLSHPDEPLGTYQAFTGVTWSADGQRVFWCHDPDSGFELAPRERTPEPRLLPGCPVAYAPGGRPAYAEGDRLVVDGATVLQASDAIVSAEWGRDDSLALLLAGGRLERIVDGEIVGRLLGAPTDRRPVLAPDSCAAAFASDAGRIELWNLCGAPTAGGTVEGTAAGWSPDGTWLAVAEDDEIVFYHQEGMLDAVRWPVGARALAWVR
jgi:hypothetical protein